MALVSWNSFSKSDNLLSDWEDLVSRLNRATRLCVEKTDFSSAPQIWKFSQRSIFGQEEQTDITHFFDDSEPMIAKQRVGTPKKDKKHYPIIS